MAATGPQALVRVGVATLWTAPDRLRPIDAYTARTPPDVRGWVGSMTAADRDDLDGRTLSQLLLGERVTVTRVDGDWSQVIAMDQPAPGLDPCGYPGWLPTAHLYTTPADGDGARAAAPAGRPGAGTAATVMVVDATSTALRDGPDSDVALPAVILGTRLAVAGPARHGWLPVRVPGSGEPLWARERDLCPPPAGTPDPARVVATAERLLDTPYVWGGLSGYGIDCSGLVHLLWRREGVTLPRDAHEQATATRPVPLGEERPGDLYFFARPGHPVHHVALVDRAPGPDGVRRMLHASMRDGRVLREIVAGEREATLVAAHRVVTW